MGIFYSTLDIDDSRYIPLELITEILLRLPAQSVARFRYVSRSWYRLIKDPVFINLHLQRSLKANPDTYLFDTYKSKIKQRQLHSLTVTVTNQHARAHSNYDYHVKEYPHPSNILKYIDEDGVRDGISLEFRRVVGSCNGLLCFTTACIHTTPTRVAGGYSYECDNSCHNVGGYALYNPVTRHLRRLPPLFVHPWKSRNNSMMVPHIAGFGYDCVSHDYKVLIYLDTSSRERQPKSMVYSLKRDAWEDIPNPPILFPYPGIRPPILANNSFYWTTLCLSGIGITCFDLFTQQFYEIPHPDQDNHHDKYRFSQLAVLGGQLCVVTYKLDIWMLSKHNYNNCCWTRIFHHQQSAGAEARLAIGFRSVGFFKDGHNMMLVICQGRDYKKLICCDVKSNEAREITDATSLDDVLKCIVNIHPWVDSLVPLY